MKKLIAKSLNFLLVAVAALLVNTTSSLLTHRPEVPAELLRK
jgi:cyclic lactone autoinducer peptide